MIQTFVAGIQFGGSQLIMRNLPRTYIVLIAVAIGFFVATGFLPGGYDAYRHYLNADYTDTVVPAWLFLGTIPFSWLGQPLNWQAFTFVTILATGICAAVWGNRRWWVVVFSAPMIWNVWLGQIEVFSIFGLILGGLVLQKRVHPAWLGIAWLALTTKPQVGLGPLLLIAWWVWREQGWKALLWSVPVVSIAIAATFLVWPDWPLRWIINYQETHPDPA